MRISFSSLATSNNPFEWVYELDEMGFNGWEIVGEGKQSLTEEMSKKIREVQETTNLEFTAHLPFSDLNLASLNQGIWDETIKQMSKAIQSVGGLTDLVVLHPGHLSPLGVELPDKAWKQNIVGIQKLCDVAKEYGIMVCVENMPDIGFLFGKFPEELIGMVENVKRENVGIALDVGHANLVDKVDAFLKLEAKHVHLHDNFGKKDDHLPLGRGMIDWKAVMKELKDHKGRFVVEARTLEEGGESLRYLRRL
ncbi:MAG: sugar phosphate isomerase/epimerase family protein [Methanocellales archaeon]|nr:sugar phosphate isomerase/epimerase family protein [Methanocellales archaeon]